MKKKDLVLNFWYLYLFILFILPNDVFEYTAIKVFSKPENIIYDLATFYFSILYIPVIIFGIYYYYKNKKYMQSKIYLFIFMIFIKDLLLAVSSESYLLKNNSWEMYMQFILSFACISIVFYKNKSIEHLYDFWEKFIMINIFTLIISIVTGIGTANYGFEKRYHAANLMHGETGFLMGVFSVYIMCVKKTKYKAVYVGIMLVLILATGSRKDFLYTLIIYALYLINYIKNSLNKGNIKITSKQIVTYMFICVIFTCSIVLKGESLFGKLDIERTMSVITSVMSDNLDFVKNDYSAQGRMDSIMSAIQLLKQKPFGTSFSIFDLQYNMQLNNYPTFPHSTFIFLYITMGILSIIPIILYILTYIKLIKLKHELRYVFLYFLIYHIVSGGAIINFKTIISYVFILWIGIKISNEAKIDKHKEVVFAN